MTTEATLRKLELLSERCDPPPWKASIEGRDHESGEDVIFTGTPDHRGEDIYVTRDSGPAGVEYLELIAEARNYLPVLIAEIRALRARQETTRDT